MYCQLESILLDSIQLTTDWNLHPWDLEETPQSLSESLTSLGILHPPIVKKNREKGYYISLCGYRRINYAKTTGRTSRLDCLVVSEKTPAELLLEIVLEDQKCTGSGLSLAEKARFYQIGLQHLDKKQLIDLFFDKLELKNRPSLISNLVRLMQQQKAIITEVHCGRLQEQMLGELLGLSRQEEKNALLSLFQKLSLGAAKQRKFFQLIRDLAYRDKLTIDELLQSSEVLEILQHQQYNVPQQIHHLGLYLFRQLYPVSLHAEQLFVEQLRALRLPETHTISHSPSFEKDEVTLSILFDNLAACKSYLGKG
jgi:ParB family chromosome partitioning protein